MTTYNFTSKEKAAVANVAVAMTKIDGNVKDEEIGVSIAALAMLGVGDNEMKMATTMDAIEAVSIIKSMMPIEKTLVSAILTSIMVVDGRIDDNEAKLLMLLSIQTGIPMMSADDAVKIISEL